MARTVAEGFSILKSNLEITGLQKETVSIRQQNVRAVLEQRLSVLDSFLTGSYSRNTMIAPLKDADVDIFVIFNSQYFSLGPKNLLDLVRSELRKTYTKTPDISRNGQAVTIHFEDFIVDVIPAFNRAGGGYLIPDSINNRWISTDPQRHIAIISQANIWHEGKLVPVIKMIKGWNKNVGQYFRSFHLEVLAFYIFNNVRIFDFPSGIRYFLDKARDYISTPALDPAGYGGNIGDYLNNPLKVQEGRRIIQKAYEDALSAEQAGRLIDNLIAITYWKKIFGNYFPSFG